MDQNKSSDSLSLGGSALMASIASTFAILLVIFSDRNIWEAAKYETSALLFFLPTLLVCASLRHLVIKPDFVECAPLKTIERASILSVFGCLFCISLILGKFDNIFLVGLVCGLAVATTVMTSCTVLMRRKIKKAQQGDEEVREKP